MGGLEDEQPPSKRMKASSMESRGLSNGKKVLKEPSMALPLNDEIIGSKGVKKAEFVRIIAEALYSLGYNKTGAHLEQESGIQFHSSVVTVFVQQILDGSWDESLDSLHKIGIADETVIKLACFIILQQKFLELLDGKKVMDALKTLRTEIAPLSINEIRVRELSSLVLSPSPKVVNGTSGKEVVKSKARVELLEDLQKVFPPTVMIPERRLLQLVEQAIDLQRDNCLFHNSVNGETSLFADHSCGRDKIPSHTVQILHDHHDEVWYLKFSNNGKYLASASSDHSAIIWKVNLDGRVSMKHRLYGHQKPVSYVSWSPCDDQILTCGVEEVVRRWDVSSGECLQVYEKGLVGSISCSWSPDGKYILSGLTDKSIIMWDLDGKETDCLNGERTLKISDLQITDDGELITSCEENRILILDRESGEERFIKEDQVIVSFTLSGDNNFLLVSLMNEELHLWSIQGDIRLVSKYRGQRRSRFIVRACFGGYQQGFIASGSEDSKVYIWHRGLGELIEALEGHSGAVNCVSWNPANPHMLASASDDRTIRIWGLNHAETKSSSHIHYCNGSS
ncbi:CTLH, C-terminal LisH motif-containing protein [Artemisia annua]|uniref:CTLH, C-terminal LisH motif-containing protein n=2 Tax=Artemisia annua TaxID=35608 RepID=A0A2U1NDW1_ARTAN|nr:CTLH, C-terminal LisH motif-containing protein [Artemisia annua]